MKIKVELEFEPDDEIMRMVKSETADADVIIMLALMTTVGSRPRSEVVSVVDDGKVLGSQNVTEMRAKRAADLAIRRAQQGGSHEH